LQGFAFAPPPNKLKLWHLVLRSRTDVWGRAESVCACKELGSCVRYRRNELKKAISHDKEEYVKAIHIPRRERSSYYSRSFTTAPVVPRVQVFW